jgi:large repetitive protein
MKTGPGQTKFVSIFVGLVVAAISLFAAVGASAAELKHEPPIELKKNAPATALLGNKQTVSLVAANPKETKRGYNLTFRDVLPAGVKFLGITGEGEAPRVIANAPTTGETTLIFENVADLSSNSSYTLTYEIEAEASAYTVGGHFKNEAEAFVTRLPRNKPTFNAKGEVVVSSYTGSAEASAETKLSAIELTKSEPSPEHELLRGLHQQQTVYTLTVQNNQLKPTKEISLEDFLPAGLEYLACDEADHTTDASGTHPGSREEYAGSGLINAAGNLPPAKAREHCLKPTEVETAEFEPPGKPKGIYTHVVWKGLGKLEPGQKLEVQYIAAVPIRRNALFAAGTKPSATSIEQAANLDNNTGPETFDEEELTNVAEAHGVFENTPTEGIPVSDADELTVTAEDLAVQKSVDKPTIGEHQISTWTMNIESSEYRFVNNVRVNDLLPNGLCPLGKANYETPTENPADTLTECNPTGNKPTAEYTNVEEQANGTFKIHWDQTTVPALAQMGPSETVTIKFPTQTRVDYQENFKNAKPILTKDSWKNEVDIAGEDFARCAPNDPLCTKGQSKIFTQEAEGTDDLDHSEASQEAGGVTIDKTVRENAFGTAVPTDCSGTYVDGIKPPLPKYRPGDKVCWQLRVNFASDLYAGTPAVTDFLPPDEKYVPGSAKKTTNNTVESTLDESEAEFGSLEWTLGSSVESGNKVFEWRFMTEMQKPTESKPAEITGNLMKFTYSNTKGQTFPLRDRAEIERAEPVLKIDKRVATAGAGTINGEGNATGVKGGETVKYSVAVLNSGNVEAIEGEVWDRLPSNNGITCTNVKTSSISGGGTCVTLEGKPVIKWTGVAVAKGTTETPGKTTLTYELTLPSNAAPAQTYNNEAGVTQYASETDKEVSKGVFESFHYYPKENIAGKTFEGGHPANLAAAIKDPAQVKTAAVALTKAGTAPFTQLGNNATNQATIGETIKYVVIATIPGGSELYGSPTITDPLGPRLALVPGSVKGFVNTVATTPTSEVTAVEEGGNPVIKFPATYVNSSGDDTIKLEFEATVTDVAANGRTVVGGANPQEAGKLSNEAKITYKETSAVGAPTVNKTATANNQIVEPLISLAKTNDAPGGVVEAGKSYEYTVTASNAENAGAVQRVSTADDTVVVDTIPSGMTPVNGTTPVEDKGTVEPGGGVWNETARTITWTVAELAPGASKSLSYFVRIEPTNAGSTYKNTVLAKTTSLPGAVGGERTAASSSNAGYEASAENTVKLVEAGLTKSVSAPKGETIGDPLNYKLTFKLSPEVTYYDATVEDQLPKGVAFDKTTFINCEPGCSAIAGKALEFSKAENGATLRAWYFGKIAAGEERTITIEYAAHIAEELEPGVKVKDKAALTNKAIGLYDGTERFPETGPPTEVPPRGGFSNKTEEKSATANVTEPKLAIHKSVAGNSAPGKTQPGDTLTYTIEVENTGDSAAYDTLVEDDNPNPAGGLGTPITAGGLGAEFLAPEAGKPLRWVIPGPIEPGKANAVKLTYQAPLKSSSQLEDKEAVDNTANIPLYFGAPKAQREAEGEGRFRQYKENPSSSVALEVALPQIVLHKTTGPNGAKSENALIGEEFEWRLKVENTSTVADAKGIDLVDLLPEGWEYVAGSTEVTPGGTHPSPAEAPAAEGKTQLSWNEVGNLGHGASLELRFKAIPTTALVGHEGVKTNEAKATGEDLSGGTSHKKGAGFESYESTDTAQAKLLTPPLTIIKKPDAGEVGAKAIAGGKSAYTIEIINGGEASATEVEVTDLLDEGNVFTAGSATAVTGTGSPVTGFSEFGTAHTVEPTPGVHKTEVAWRIPTIPAKGKAVITVPVALAPSLPDPTVLHDIATVTSKQQPLPVSDEGALNVSREADMEIKKTGPIGDLIPGERAVYTLVVENKGPSNAEAVTIRDPLPAGTKFITADSPCKLASGEVVCELTGEFEVGPTPKREFEVTLEVLPSTTGPIVNEAEVETSTKDPVSPNNKSKVENPTKPQDSLTVVKRVPGPTKTVLLGGTFEYELEVTNAGPSDAAGVKVTDHLPAQEQLVSAESPCAGSATEANLIECPIGAIPAGAPAVKLHFKVKAIGSVPPGGEKVTNVATVTSTTEDVNPNNTGEAEVEILPAADLSVLKTAPATVAPNGDLTYTLHVENHGPSVAHEVKVSDPLPLGVEFKSASEGCSFAAGVVTCAVVAPEGELGFEAEENSVDFQVTVHVPFALGGKPLTNTASVKGKEADPNTENDSSTVTTTVGPAADLSIVKTMGKAQAGQPLTYTLAITNKGPSTASAVTVKDTLPAGTTFKTAAPSQGTCGAIGQEVTCNLGALPSGGSAQVSITVDVGATVTGTLKNVAKVEGPEPDPDKTNNESTVEGPVSPPLPTTPNLKVTKTADTSAPQVGTPFDYHVTVTNMSGGEAKNVKVLDTLNGPVKVLSIESDSGKCEAAGSKITCTIPRIPVGKTVNITYSVVAEEAGPLSNTASAQAANGEKAPANNHAVKSVKAKSGKASFTLAKTASEKVVPGGKKVGFTIALHNGPVALVNATICDRLPAALVFVRAAGAKFVGGEACWQKRFVAAKQTVKLHLTARAVRGYKPRKARNVASASAENAPGRKHASATVRIKPAFAGAPGGVTG